MKWEEVRKLYPNQFVKLKILQYHTEGNKKFIEDIAVIKAYDNNRDATRELVRAKEDELVYHTINKDIILEIYDIRGYRGVM